MEKAINRLKAAIKEKGTNKIPEIKINCQIAGYCELRESKKDLCYPCSFSKSSKRNEIIQICKSKIYKMSTIYPAVAILYNYETEYEIAVEVAQYAKESGLIVIAYCWGAYDVKSAEYMFNESSPFDIIQWYYDKKDGQNINEYLDIVHDNKKAIIVTPFIEGNDHETARTMEENFKNANHEVIAISYRSYGRTYYNKELISSLPDCFVFVNVEGEQEYLPTTIMNVAYIVSNY